MVLLPSSMHSSKMEAEPTLNPICLILTLSRRMFPYQKGTSLSLSIIRLINTGIFSLLTRKLVKLDFGLRLMVLLWII